MKKNFTLIELMVVVVVFTILVAILLPTKSKAHDDKALTYACINNLKQLAIGSILYCTDYDDYFHAASYGMSEGITSDDNNYFYVYNPLCNLGGKYVNDDGTSMTLEMSMDDEDSWKLWQCPSMNGTEAWEDWYKTTPKTTRPKTGYQYNGNMYNNQYLTSHFGSPKAKPTSWVRNVHPLYTGNFVLYFDRCGFAGNGGSWAVYWNINKGQVPGYTAKDCIDYYCRHNDMVNVAFADGHCETVNKYDWEAIANEEDGDTGRLAFQIGGNGEKDQ